MGRPATPPGPDLVIGVTGGIASGKSTVTGLFAARGLPVVDTDLIAREVVRPGSPGLARLTRAFGRGIVNARGVLDRTALRRRILAQSGERERLNRLLHPLIFQRMQARLAAIRAPLALVAIPLLVETGADKYLDRILVVDVPETCQIKRLKLRDGMTQEDAERMLVTQASREERLAHATDVIDNAGPPSDLTDQVACHYRLWLKLVTGLGAAHDVE
ncbi:dephospho-CoA kinase [Alkalilimnicola ehrlichii]|uniref:dephospho-CoA kinase n=1 Tax=Alkalilimnicola ehrlichii TaxID=351052 RepID=UPI003BA072A0